ILAMDKSHVEYIGKIAPEARGKTMLFGHWLNQREIPDPYRKSEEAFNSVYDLIEQAGQKWARTLAE
ncbi:TPA: protein tyrosine phosphatase, partial [Klebsiella pneumoniae]|nr:protein tyrosine phosphatase [Klebsiella pneumoniae]